MVFVKGQSGNPGGRTPLPPELKAIKAMSPQEAARYIAKYARMPTSEVELAVKNTKLPMIEMSIAKIFLAAAAKADPGRLNMLLDRAVGKVTDAQVLLAEELGEGNQGNVELAKMALRGNPWGADDVVELKTGS